MWHVRYIWLLCVLSSTCFMNWQHVLNKCTYYLVESGNYGVQNCESGNKGVTNCGKWKLGGFWCTHPPLFSHAPQHKYYLNKCAYMWDIYGYYVYCHPHVSWIDNMCWINVLIILVNRDWALIFFVNREWAFIFFVNREQYPPPLWPSLW